MYSVSQVSEVTEVRGGFRGAMGPCPQIDNPVAMYFHCLAHKLNLVLVQACKVNRMAVAFFNTIEQLYKFFANPSSHEIFLNMQNTLGLKVKEIGQLSDTRWACRWKSVEALKSNYAAVVKSLVQLSDPVATCSAEATGLSLHLQKPEFVISLIIFEDFLRIINVAHKALQCSSITLGKAGAIVERLSFNFRNRRSKNSYLVLYKQAEDLCKLNGIDIQSTASASTRDSAQVPKDTVTSRAQRPVKSASCLRDFLITTTLGQRERVDDPSVTINSNARVEPAGSPLYDQLYLPVCDTLIGQLEFRFDKDSLIMAKAVDAVLRCDKEGITAIVDKYANILNINPQLLSSEMELFASMDTAKWI